MVKGCALSTGYLPRGGLPRNSVDRITDRPDMTSAVDRGHKASTQTIKTKILWVHMHVFAQTTVVHLSLTKLDSFGDVLFSSLSDILISLSLPHIHQHSLGTQVLVCLDLYTCP